MAVILLGGPGVPGPIPLRGHLFFPAPTRRRTHGGIPLPVQTATLLDGWVGGYPEGICTDYGGILDTHLDSIHNPARFPPT